MRVTWNERIAYLLLILTLLVLTIEIQMRGTTVYKNGHKLYNGKAGTITFNTTDAHWVIKVNK